MEREKLNELGSVILDSCVTVYRELGPGLLESAYVIALARELELRKIFAKRQVVIDMQYKGATLEKVYVIDILVEDEIILEIKTVHELHPIHEAQLITYLKITGKKLG